MGFQALIAFWVVFRALAGPLCPPECIEALERGEEIEKSLKRLNGIREANLDFLSTLESDQDSRRLKANSNLRIADKRIAEIMVAKASVERVKKKRHCKACGGNK